MQNNYLLITGGQGLLGKEIQRYIMGTAPTHQEMDINDYTALEKYKDASMVIHCAAYTNVAKAEIDKEECFKTNVIGTMRLCNVFRNAYFIYISSEYVKNPVNFYSQTKMWAEWQVQKLPKHLIIRTLFKPNPFPYEYAFVDQYTQGDYVDKIAPMIVAEVMAGRKGIVEIGTGRKTMFELARQTRPNIKGISVDDVKDVKLPKDYLT